MLIDIKDIEPEGRFVERAVPLGEITGYGDEPIAVGSTLIGGILMPGRRGVDFKGRLESSLKLQCVRCLEPFEMPVSAEVHLVFVGRIPETASSESHVNAADCELFVAPEGKANLSEVAREQLVLNVPWKPLCRPDCAGLCPVCGVNRNATSCECGLARPTATPGAERGSPAEKS